MLLHLKTHKLSGITPLCDANLPGPQGGIPGSTAGNSRAPVTDFMAEMMVAPSQQPQGLAGGAAQAVGAATTAAESPSACDSAAQGSC